MGGSDSSIFQNLTGDSEVLGWPKSAFAFFRKMSQKTQTHFLVNPTEGLRVTALGYMLPYRQNHPELLGSNSQKRLLHGKLELN